jgi:hypothetical protein
MEADFTVTAEVLDEVSVTVRVTSESTVTLPKLRLVVLSFNKGFSDALAGVDSSTP